MADPTSLLQFAERELTERKAALLAATAEVTSRRTALLAADAALKTAAGDVAEANDKLADVRRKLAAIEMPADGEPLLVELRTNIIDQRDKAAALAAADLAHAKAAAILASAQALLPKLTTCLSAAEAAAKAASAAKKRRADAIALVVAQPLANVNQAATDALAGPAHGKVKTRIEGALPEPLRKQALARAAQALAAVGRAEARQAAALAVTDALAEETGLASDRVYRLQRAEVHAEAALLGWVDALPRRLTTAVAALKRLAELNPPALTAQQKASIDADAVARAAAAQAEAKWDGAAAKVADAFDALEIERLRLRAADPGVDTTADEADINTEVGKAKKKWDDAKAELATEDANFTAAMRTTMSGWRAAVPDSLWLEADAFLAADADLNQLKTASAAPLITALQNAETNLLAALIDDAKRRKRLDWSAARLATDTAFAIAARSRANALRTLAFRGHPTLNV